MKKDPLNIAILVCLIIVIILLVLLLIPFGDEKNNKTSKKDVKTEEKVDKELEDNQSLSSMIITVTTGLDRNDRIIIRAIVGVLILIDIGLILKFKNKIKEM